MNPTLTEPSRQADGTETRHARALIAVCPRWDHAAMLAVPDGEPAEELHCALVDLGDAEWLPSAQPGWRELKRHRFTAVCHLAAQPR